MAVEMGNRCDERCELDTAAGAVGRAGRRSDPQAALLRPGVLRDGDRAVLAAGVADGVPARGDPQAGRLRGVRDPRPVDHRRADRCRQRTGLPQRLPSSRRKAGGGQRKSAHLRLPVPRLVLGLDGATRSCCDPTSSPSTTCARTICNLVSVRCELWGGCAWINLDDDAPPLRDCIEPFASIYDAWKVESLRVEWWQSCRLPVNWKLATAAFMEGYHVPQTHPQLLPSAQPASRRPACTPIVQNILTSCATLGDGMARHDPRERRPHRRRPAGHRAAGRSGRRDGHLAQRAQRRHRELASGPAAATSPTSTSLIGAASSTPSVSASRTTSSCPPTAAPRRTGSVRSDPRRRCSRSGRSPVFRPDLSAGKADTTRADGARRPALATDPGPGLLQPAASSKKACIPRALSTCACRTRSKG